MTEFCQWSDEKAEDGYYHCTEARCAGKATRQIVRRGCDIYKSTLIGNRIADITAQLGIKECSGCRKRKRLLNRVHQKIREILS